MGATLERALGELQRDYQANGGSTAGEKGPCLTIHDGSVQCIVSGSPFSSSFPSFYQESLDSPKMLGMTLSRFPHTTPY